MPDQRHNVEADVLIPAGQALVIGAAAVIGTLTLATPLAILAGWRWWIPPAAGLALGGLAFTAAAVTLTLDHHRDWRGPNARVVHDYEVDREAVEPLDPEILRVELTRDGGRRMDYIDLPGTPAQLRTLALGPLNGKGTGEAAWTGAGNPFSRSEYAALRAAMLQRGLAAWTNPDHHAQGWELTAAGRAILRKVADPPTPRR